jgi:small GTP-binding protein
MDPLHYLSDLFSRQSGLTQDQAKAVQAAVENKIADESPIKIALIGQTGVGKSSTINSLFNAGSEVSHTSPCTHEAQEYAVDVKEISGTSGKPIRVFDMPGLGETEEADTGYLKIYRKVLPNVDVALWILDASSRAMKETQSEIRSVHDILQHNRHPRMVFALNKVDSVHPGQAHWNREFNLPSPEQDANIAGRVANVREFLHSAFGRDLPVVEYSALQRYRLDELLHEMLLAAAGKRRWLLEASADVAKYEDLVDADVLQRALAVLESTTVPG